ncbi:beta strand repeat-containing protein [Ferruginibacter yonginensis]|uniref:Beta strand repeat-containing protein n=1 Tax=Ferruginibacter yonginensis TaxID=1310416 RepID=A0ABV8QND1_9BACT
MRRVLLVFTILVFVLQASAATRTWRGRGYTGGGATGGTDLNAAANWNGGTALLTTDDYVINLNNNNTNTALTLSANFVCNSLTINANLTDLTNASGNTFSLTLGSFDLSIAGNFAVTNSAADANDNGLRPYVMTFTIPANRTITIGGNFSLSNSDISLSDNSITFENNGTVSVTGTTTLTSNNTGTSSLNALLVGNAPANFVLNGAVSFGGVGTNDVNNRNRFGCLVAANTGSFTFRNNVTFGANSSVNTIFTDGTVVFDGTANQTLTYNNTAVYIRLPNVIIGSTNNPTLVLAGSVTPDNILQNLTINGSATLDLNSRQWNRHTNGGAFNLKNTATLLLGANTSSNATTVGTATLIAGSNFPSGFTTYTLDSTSTVHFNLAGAQTVPGTTQGITSYGNLTLTGNTKTLGADIAIFRNLNIAANTTFALGNFNTTLRSNSQTTANITSIPTTANITYGTGRFNIERYLFAKKSWRSLATPIDPTDATTITQAWRENGSALTSTGFGTQISGPASYIGMDQTTVRGSMKSFNMALGDFVEVTNTGNAIYNASGYFVFVRGDRAVNTTGTTGATTLRMSGRIVRNDQAYNITANKFISIGNPYASRVDVRNLTFGGGAVQSFYVWNPNAPGSYNVGGYQVYVKEIAGTNYRLNGLPLGAINNFIESGQAVFFQANGSAGTVTFTEASKASGSSLVSRMGSMERPGATTPSLAINLKTTDVDGTQFDADGIVVDFDANFTNTIDENDVRKVSNTVDNLSMRSNGVLLTADRRVLLRNNDTIFLNIAGLRTANYSFSIDPSLIDGLGLEAFLVDAFLGTQTPVSLTDVTTINFATTTDAASKANTRFMLVFKPAAVLPVTFTTITAVRDAINKQVAVRWNVATEINITRYEVERSATGTGFAPIATVNPISNNGVAVSYSINDAAALATTNFYRVKAISNNGTVQYSAVVKVAALPTASGFVVYPNPVVGNTINLQANQVTKGAYNVQLVNQAGQIVYKGLLNINSDNQSTSLVLDAATAAGVYTLVLDNDQQKVSLQVLVR